ncbi:cell division topological specificity factor [Canna indica]|uniref:Cell division topological specificity factor n=1 Tax=Canna indica TaxID=4628 RepID=A0AAQ3K2D3_9LILI|nr:cell division topological specificity factor [Canna indica]
MAISADLKVFVAAFASHPNYRPLKPTLPSSKIRFGHFFNGTSDLKIAQRWPQLESSATSTANPSQVCLGTGGNNLSATVNQDAEGFLLNVVNMSFFDRLGLAWRMLFPTAKVRNNSNARIAKQRLKMILFSDRCAISDEAKQKIVSNIIGALSEFVEIDSQDKVQLNVSADTDIGTVCSVTVPVRRVRPEYQDSEEDYAGKISGIDYKDTGETSGTVDVTFDFFLPNKK